MSNSIRVRFAPSPTGFVHVGSLRTALYNYLYARKVGGKTILRIEDTDRSRYVEGAVENLLSVLDFFGLKFDEGPGIDGECGPYFQSERTEIYRKYIDILLDKKAAYHCFCSPETLDRMRAERKAKGLDTGYDGSCSKLSEEEVKSRLANGEKSVIRLKVPQEGEITFYDLIREKVTFPWKMVDDQILMKSDGFPTYHLANVIDDHLMEISHVIRGEEWLSSVPKHLLLYKYFEWKPPRMAHLPLLLNSDRSKLSKRQGDVAVEDFTAKGFLKEALLNFAVLLGWHPKGDRELFTLPELEKEFSLKRVNKAGAVFDPEKLKWMNGHYLRNMKLEEIAEKVEPFMDKAGYVLSNRKHFLELVDIARNRISTLSEVTAFAEPFFRELEFAEQDFEILQAENSQKLFKFWIENIMEVEKIDENLVIELLKRSGKELGIKGRELYPPLRLALYGKAHGPELNTIIDILGKEETLNRFENALI